MAHTKCAGRTSDDHNILYCCDPCIELHTRWGRLCAKLKVA